MSDSVWPHPWDSPGKNTGVGCHFLLQCIKVKSESDVTQPCLTLCDPMDCSLPGSSIHGIFQARVLEWGAIAFSDQIALGSGYHNGQYCVIHFEFLLSRVSWTFLFCVILQVLKSSHRKVVVIVQKSFSPEPLRVSQHQMHSHT